MAKGNILQDTFEQIVELGGSTVKKSAQQVAQTFNPLSKANESSNESHKSHKSNASHESNKSHESHTPLDFKKLQEKFKDKEKMKVEGLRNRLFQIVKTDEERSLQREKMKEADKKRQEEYLAQEKKRKEEEKRQRDLQGNIPQGKVRRSIFSPKKTAKRLHTETKPAVGKQ